MSSQTYYEQPETIRGFKYIRLRSGRLISFWDSHTAAENARTDLNRAVSRMFKLRNSEYDLESIEWFIDKLESYIGALRKYLAELRGDQIIQERIAMLRNTEGRTPEEAEAFHQKANELEQRLQ